MTNKVKKIVLVVGARPNFMKAAPLYNQLKKEPDRFEPIIIHTGQHYDDNMSRFFFEDLGLPKPDLHLGAGSGSHAEQTARIMIGLEQELLQINPDLVIVFGDINSTLATAVVTSKINLKLAHVESGLRSFDNSMPEEINRIVTDRIADLLFVTEPVGVENLKKEGIDNAKIFLCGNIMIDSLQQQIKAARNSTILSDLELKEKNYLALTLHRPSNVDDKDALSKIISLLNELAQTMPVVFPCHPRTRKNIEQFEINSFHPDLKFIEPLGYFDFLKLLENAALVISDSGGVQADTTYFNVPCLTLRETTEQPSTIQYGTNTLCGRDTKKIKAEFEKVIAGKYKSGRLPELWDGKTAERIVEIIKQKI